jgi:two-component system, NarL family, response regulator NreC
MKPLQILIADDHEALREGVRRIIEREPDMQVCGIAITGREAVTQAEKFAPDVVMLDIGMPELNGLDAARQIRRLLPLTEILIFTAHETDDLIKESFEAGAKSFILKSEASSYLLEAIRSLSQHKPFYTDRVSQVIFSRFLDRADLHRSKDQSSSPDTRLSLREREVIQLLAEGKSNKGVATALGISLRTAETHRASVMQKLGVDSFASLVRYAIRNGIIEP